MNKLGRMSETEYEDVETEHTEEVEYGDILQQITPLKVQLKFSTARLILFGTASATPGMNLFKRSPRSKCKKERLGHEEAIRLQEQIDEEERKRIFKKVHHVSSTRGQDIFMLVEEDYPLTKELAILMLSNKLRVDQQLEMADEILTKI
ncbi:hypothetical protein Tco_0299761 [Tanacetum coccineum]